MWATGSFFKDADAAARLGHPIIARTKAEFAKACRALFETSRRAGKITLDDEGGATLRAALQWAAMQHEQAAQSEKVAAIAATRRAFAGECARLADLFQKPN